MKEKVISQVIYIAEDGTEFTNKADCILYESKQHAEEDIFKYISFHDSYKNKIQLNSFIKDCFIQRYINNKEDFEFFSPIEDLLQDADFIHISKAIPNKEYELLIEEFMKNMCNNDLPDITRFDFKKGITYYYDENLECFTNTEYEKEQIKKQTELLAELEDLENFE